MINISRRINEGDQISLLFNDFSKISNKIQTILNKISSNNNIVLIAYIIGVLVVSFCCIPSVITRILPTTITEKPENKVVVNEVLPEEQETGVITDLKTAKQANISIATNPENTLYKVTQVVDGDTIKIETVGTLRLIGIDTPETVDPRKPVQCFGIEASNKAKELLSNQNVRLEFDESQGRLDKYGRTLAYVIREDGLFFNKEMITQGFAHEYTYNTPYKYQLEFKEAQINAQTNKLGLWGSACKAQIPTSTIPTQYTCDCNKGCAELKSCEEAQYQLIVCGCSARDGDKDGIACNSLCK